MYAGVEPTESGRVLLYEEQAGRTRRSSRPVPEPHGGLARWHETGNVADMSTVTEIEVAIEKLSLAERCEIARWLSDQLASDESPELLAAVDEGIRSLERNGAHPVSREELQQKVRQWSGVSR